MRKRVRIFLYFAIIVALTATLPMSCKKSGSGGQDNRVELSDVRLTIIDPQKFRLALKYRFIQGKPVDGRGCACHAEIRYGERNGFLEAVS